jgi:hypothetical protein
VLFRKSFNRRKFEDCDPTAPPRYAIFKKQFTVPFERMLKGTVSERDGVPIRQFGVYVDGVVRLVTSGEMVDRETYDAMIAAGALEPDADYVPEAPKDGPKVRILSVADGEMES